MKRRKPRGKRSSFFFFILDKIAETIGIHRALGCWFKQLLVSSSPLSPVNDFAWFVVWSLIYVHVFQILWKMLVERKVEEKLSYEMLCVVGLVLYKVENKTTLRRTSEVQTRARDKCSLLVT